MMRATDGIRLTIFVLMSLIVQPATASATNCCSVNGGSCNIIPPLTHGQSGWTGDICSTTLTGTNCVAKLDNNASIDAGYCISIGSGVTLDLNGFTIDCTNDTDGCDNGVFINGSGGSGGAVVVKNGSITGLFDKGVDVEWGGASSVTDLVVDGARTGLWHVRGDITRTVVRNNQTGIGLYPGSDVTDTMIRNSTVGDGIGGVGIYMDQNDDYSTSAFDNIAIVGADRAFWNLYTTASPLQRSEIQLSNHCDCWVQNDVSPCQSISACVDISNTTTPTFVNNSILP